MIDDAVIFWTKRSISNQKFGFKGSGVGPSFNYSYEFNDIGNKREEINPEH